MKYRCNTPTHKLYHHYGGRGITYTKEWEEYENFYYWAINNGYQDNLTLDRENNDGNYEPSNCRWITNEDQQINRSTTHFVEIDGQVKSAKEWCEIFDLNYNTFFTRINTYGWDIVRALTTPVTKRKKPIGFYDKYAK